MNNIFQSSKVVILALALSFGLSYVYAWTAPASQPPAGNVSSPINTSATAQTKAGGLTVGSIISGAATTTSLSVGSGKITTTGSISGGATTVTSLNAGSGNISTTGSITGWGITANSLATITDITVAGIKVCLKNGVNCPAASAETDPKVGSLTTNYIPKWGGTSLGNSSIYTDGTNIGIGTNMPDNGLDGSTAVLTVAGAIKAQRGVIGNGVVSCSSVLFSTGNYSFTCTKPHIMLPHISDLRFFPVNDVATQRAVCSALGYDVVGTATESIATQATYTFNTGSWVSGGSKTFLEKITCGSAQL
ncbi:MAG: hypothetical protein HZB10_03005 [Candidatus Yonathbacteria bacterium]|nr:hypothetical protein [Candidatus Yonathbacteria bacterium]